MPWTVTVTDIKTGQQYITLCDCEESAQKIHTWLAITSEGCATSRQPAKIHTWDEYAAAIEFATDASSV